MVAPISIHGWNDTHSIQELRCHIVFQGHLSNFKITWAKKKSIICFLFEHFWMITPIWIHGLLGNDKKVTFGSMEEVHSSFSKSSIKTQSHMGRKIDLSQITRPVAAIKFLRLALFLICYCISCFLLECYRVLTFLCRKMQPCCYYISLSKWVILPLLYISLVSSAGSFGIRYASSEIQPSLITTQSNTMPYCIQHSNGEGRP